MDLKLSILNGYKATKQIKEFSSNLTTVALTAYTTSKDKHRTKTAGCNNFVSKPRLPV